MGQDTIPTFDVLIISGGHGGARVAINLRQDGFAGTIALDCMKASRNFAQGKALVVADQKSRTSG